MLDDLLTDNYRSSSISFSMVVRGVVVAFLVYFVYPYASVVNGGGYKLAAQAVRESPEIRRHVGFVKDTSLPFLFGSIAQCHAQFTRTDLRVEVSGVRGNTDVLVSVVKLKDGWHIGQDATMDGEPIQLGQERDLHLRTAYGCRNTDRHFDFLYQAQFMAFMALLIGWEGMSRFNGKEDEAD